MGCKTADLDRTYRFPKGWQQLGDELNPALQELDRIPNASKGTAAGAGYGVESQAAVNGGECGCP